MYKSIEPKIIEIQSRKDTEQVIPEQPEPTPPFGPEGPQTEDMLYFDGYCHICKYKSEDMFEYVLTRHPCGHIYVCKQCFNNSHKHCPKCETKLKHVLMNVTEKKKNGDFRCYRVNGTNFYPALQVYMS